jgi:hypothetical protein
MITVSTELDYLWALLWQVYLLACWSDYPWVYLLAHPLTSLWALAYRLVVHLSEYKLACL